MVPVGCEVTGDTTALGEVRRTIEAGLTRATPTMIEAWLAELSVITPKRAEDGFTEALRVEVYVTRLSDFPADVVREALLGRAWPFWPSWAELEAVCKTLAAPRRLMLSALLRVEADARLPPEPERVRCSPEAAARILAEAGMSPSRLAAIAGGRRMPPPNQPGHVEPEPLPQPTAQEAADRPYTPAEMARMRALRPAAAVPAEERA